VGSEVVMKGNTLVLGGYSIEELPNLRSVPYAFYRHKDGRVVRLPADPYSLNHYLKKGLVIVSENDSPAGEEVVPAKPAGKPIKRRVRRKSKKGGKP